MNRAVVTLLTVPQRHFLWEKRSNISQIDCPTPKNHTEIGPFTSCFVILFIIFLIATFFIFRLHHKLPIYYCISIVFLLYQLKNGVDGEITFVNFYDHSKVSKIWLQYIFFFYMNICKIPKFAKYFHIFYINNANNISFSLMS